jgi:hypothetical protein
VITEFCVRITRRGLGETRRTLVQPGDEATGPLGCRWLKGSAVALRVLAVTLRGSR